MLQSAHPLKPATGVEWDIGQRLIRSHILTRLPWPEPWMM